MTAPSDMPNAVPSTDPAALARQMRALADREVVRAVRVRFALALDARDWVLLDSLLADEVDTDFSAWGVPPQRVPREALVASWRHNFRRPGLVTQHLVGDQLAEVDGDRATCTSRYRAHHRIPGFDEAPGGDTFTLYAGYTDRLVRTADGWRIAAMTYHHGDAVGNPALIA